MEKPRTGEAGLLPFRGEPGATGGGTRHPWVSGNKMGTSSSRFLVGLSNAMPVRLSPLSANIKHSVAFRPRVPQPHLSEMAASWSPLFGAAFECR